MSSRDEDPKAYAKKHRYMAETERLLVQFLRNHQGVGTTEYANRHEFAFEWDEERKECVNQLIGAGLTFEEAFSMVKEGWDGTRLR